VRSVAACQPDLAYADYPLEQLASSRSTSFQQGFARMTMHLLPAFDDVLLDASAKGLVILAASELALATPAEVIRQIHADDVIIEAPKVRFACGDAVEEPVMWVRAVVPREDTEAVVHDLIGREAKIEEVDWLAPSSVVRARAPLRKVLGYPAALSELCEGKADLQMWLSHYAPMPPGPDKAA
jgi:hypothetical protein